MQKRYEMRVEGFRAVPFFIGTILFTVLLGGLVVLLMTVGIAAFLVGLALSGVAGLVLAVRRGLGLSGGVRREEEEFSEILEREREWESRRLDLGDGEIIDVEEVIEVEETHEEQKAKHEE